MRKYEIVTIVNPDIPDDSVSQTMDKLSRMIQNRGGTVELVKRWGRRKLAYPIKSHTEGHYTLTYFTLEPHLATELDAEINVTEEILRHLIVKTTGPVPVATEAPKAEAASAEPAPGEEGPVSEPGGKERSEELKGEA